MNSRIVETFKCNMDLLLILGIYMIQQTNNIIGFSGYILICVISYIEIKKRQDKKNKYIYISIISSSKKDYGIYNNIIETINNKEYKKIDIMKSYNELLNSINNLDYNFDKINNCSDIFCFLATIDNVLHYNKKWTKCFIENGQHILDIYARLVNEIHNISVIINFRHDSDIDDMLLKKELDKLYLRFNYNDSINNKLSDFCYKYNLNNIYQM
jgi:hypothetical protein